ncbi:uncharacterized protein Z519_09090 [Cladophialophora bantiana CBS 173.52]|uniref:DUF2428 domain-containing protein n=1 Tax=Cladophialophora bantiana (strain ATCC 10958 / CBS 173.52 / CDC B-1940 / NIH 8579) TaxID=1442370 RepID=A0A0D2I0S4_CLAB1|nr:uncharacterized protein Z519_09090 [Cladophialophora bantiana CBS 173.52]KIW90444.1 hypothetical protein Z519_09090 [Cladophialophora bantiana CBS 173.52]
MDPVSCALRAEVPLPISLLSELGKGSLRNTLSDNDRSQDVSQILALWRKLVLTAASPQVADKHITSASNALCVYLHGAVASPTFELREFVLSQDVWFEACHCAHRAFNDGKTKAAFQIMDTLCDLLDKQGDPKVFIEILRHASLPLVRIVLLSLPRSEIKKACLMLACLHQRTPLLEDLDQLVQHCIDENRFLWTQLLSQHNFTLDDISAIGHENILQFLLALVFAMTNLDTRSAALKVCSVLCSDASKPMGSPNLQPLAEHVIKWYLEKNHEALGDFAENVLPVILDSKEKFMAFVQPYSKSCQESGSRMALFIATLKVGRANSILTESETLNLFVAAFPPLASPLRDERKMLYWCKQMLMAADPEVRTLTYGLLVSSPATNAIVLPETLECIATSMKYLHDDADAHERGEILSITKRLLRRLQNSRLTLRKSAHLLHNDKDVDAILDSYRSFTKTFYTFLKEELNTGISYPRHILGLLSLQYLLDLGMGLDMFSSDKGLTTVLVCLVLDPFEDVRSIAAAILQRLAIEGKSLVTSAKHHSLLERVEALAVKTLRADHADAMGRLCALQSFRLSPLNGPHPDALDTDMIKVIRRLEQSITGQEAIELKPGCVIPIHALLLATHYRLRHLKRQGEEIAYICSTLVNVCGDIWNQVRLQLCVDSPETASEVEGEITSEGPKDLLSYSWRALRDSSLVLQSLILVATPSEEFWSAVGDLCMDQLISLRHRGAFSTVAQTFSQCCDKVRSSSESAVRGLIHKWYQIALDQINEQANRLTRRSAGLPAMIAALLNPSDSDFFFLAISDLMAIAERVTDRPLDPGTEDVKLPQVHALNCLKDIMTNSKFAAVVAQYLERMLELAATCLSSKVWAIRNCGLMLLRACINRLDPSSTREAVGSTHQPYEKGKGSTPLAIAFRLLDAPTFGSDSARNNRSSATELVFAGLDLLGHAILGVSEADEAARLVMEQLTNPTWAIRDHAALLLATRLLRGSPGEAIIKLLQEIGLSGPENQVHGVLLCCRYLMGRATVIITSTELDSITECLVNKMVHPNGSLVPHSPYVYAAWLDLLNGVASCILENNWGQTVRRMQRLEGLVPFATRIDRAHYPYLSRRILLYKTYHILIDDSHLVDISGDLKILASQYVRDADALSFVLDLLSQKHCHKPSRTLVELLICLIDEGHMQSCLSPGVLEQTYTCLALCLDYISDVSIDMLRVLFDRLDFSQLHTPRDLRNAALKLQASVLGKIQTAHRGSISCAQQIEGWLRAVQDISTDFLDIPTRLSAAKAISTYIGYLRLSGIMELRPNVRLQLLLVLYDLLNDDDEEIRLEAVHAARKLRLHQRAAMDNLDSCALAERENLVSELARQFGETSNLAEAAIVNILRVGHNASDSSLHGSLISLFGTSVNSKLLTISKSKNDLFAEERQNLYMDDIREIKEWTQLLHNGTYAFATQELSESAMKWTLEGLDQVLQLLEADSIKNPVHQATTCSNEDEVEHRHIRLYDPLMESLFGHPLGLTYDHEILVVMIQVVSLAGVCIQHDRTIQTRQLRAKLERMKEILACSDSEANPVMLGAVQRALRSQ